MINRRNSALLLLLGFATLGAACKKTKPATEIVLEISTNIPFPSQMDTLSLTISSSNLDGAVLDQVYSLGTDPNQIMLPKRMTLAPSGTGATVTIQVDGLLANNVIVSRTVITSFLQDHSLFLHIDLLQECVGMTTCLPGQTCVSAGVCTDATIAPSSLLPLTPSSPPSPRHPRATPAPPWMAPRTSRLVSMFRRPRSTRPLTGASTHGFPATGSCPAMAKSLATGSRLAMAGVSSQAQWRDVPPQGRMPVRPLRGWRLLQQRVFRELHVVQGSRQ